MLLARSGREGLEVARSLAGSIDLVVTDVIMPLMSGPEMATQLGALCPDMKVLFVSAYPAGSPELQLAPRAALLPKPFSPRALVAAIEAALLDSEG